MSKLASCVGLCLGVLLPGVALGEPVIRSGKPCQTTDGLCVVIGTGGDIPAISTFKFTAPSNGTISVTATGAMQCSNISSEKTHHYGVFDLSSQIVRDNQAPNASGPGGARYASRLPPLEPPASSYSLAVNLAATRVFSARKGVNTFRYKITRNRIDAGTSCNVLNVTLSGIFVP